ncbi:MAG: PolC-type DNA polymerase III, partial [Candidatus Wallbacteria bacterium]|nr:PolC-type DNA polymerase III [Candidatus Wallbacteria bacterium]
LDDPETIRMFQEVKTLGVPEFGTHFVRQVLTEARVRNFGDIVKICGLTHGTDVWNNNARDLVQKGVNFSEVITMRDDILIYLVHCGVSEKDAFEIMEKVRKGKTLGDKQVAMLKDHGVPDWYIESCRKIKYLFPKAHAVAYAVMAFQIAYFKVHLPLAFYATYFSIRPDVFDYDNMVAGREGIGKKMNYINNLPREEKSKRLIDLAGVLEVALEMCEKGLEFYPLSLDGSDSAIFKIYGEEGLICPFSALDGVGTQAAMGIVESRKDRPFSSIEDLQQRAKLNKTVIETLRRARVLRDLPETEQLQLF